MTPYVLVFDICSSTTMIEDLVANEHPEDFNRLLARYDDFLAEKSNHYAFEVHKFLGDGHILLFKSQTIVDKLLEFFIELTGFSTRAIDWFIRDFIATTELPRVGITAGLDQGSLGSYKSRYTNHTEYFGRAINLATRLQNSRSSPENVNRLLFSSKLYLQIHEYLLKIACAERSRALKNINNGKTPSVVTSLILSYTGT